VVENVGTPVVNAEVNGVDIGILATELGILELPDMDTWLSPSSFRISYESRLGRKMPVKCVKVSGRHLWLRMLDIEEMDNQIGKCSLEEFQDRLYNEAFVLAMNEGKYRRGVVKKILEGEDRARVYFADYGTSEVVPKTMVRN